MFVGIELIRHNVYETCLCFRLFCGRVDGRWYLFFFFVLIKQPEKLRGKLGWESSTSAQAGMENPRGEDL